MRINEVNENLHAVTEINPEALKIAASRDEERKNGKSTESVSYPFLECAILIKIVLVFCMESPYY
jgi:hypothetical protein